MASLARVVLIGWTSFAAALALASCGDDRALGAGCDYFGAHHDIGSSWPSQDRCNTCTCDADGMVSCTLRGCVGEQFLVRRDLDLLFVIDDSATMADAQASLRTGFSRLVDVLAAGEGGLPDLHIGIISSDLGAGAACAGDGDDGRFLVGDPDAPPADHCWIEGDFLSDVASPTGRVTNYSGSLSAVFDCAAALGTGGCTFARPLEAMKRALDGNADFLRDEAALAIVIATDQDDCSANPDLFDPGATETLGPLGPFRCFEYGVTCDEGGRSPGPRHDCQPASDSLYFGRVQQYVDFVMSKKPDPSLIVVGEIVGIPPDDNHATVVADGGDPSRPALAPTCESPTVQATPAFRLRAFADGFPARHLAATICAADVSEGLIDIGERIADTLRTPCLIGELADTDPDTAGLQVECVITDVQFRNTPQQTETQIPACACMDAGACTTHPPTDAEAPCWYLARDPERCAAQQTQLKVTIVRGGAGVSSGTTTRAQCVVPP